MVRGCVLLGMCLFVMMFDYGYFHPKKDILVLPC